MGPKRFPTVVPRVERDRAVWPSLAGSAFVHAFILFLAIWDWSSVPDITPTKTPGGEGPVGGGGGGGGPRVTYMVLPEYQPPERARPTEEAQQRPEDIVIPIPTLQQVDLETPQFEIPRETAPVQGAEVLGRGAGTGGGLGAGTGSGGGVGSGRGTGTGSAVGPGTGGEGGDVFPPAPRYTILPPQPTPSSVKGRTYVVLLTVSAEGRVLQVQVSPRIRDSAYRRKFIAELHQWRFAPGYTRDGTPVIAQATVTITL